MVVSLFYSELLYFLGDKGEPGADCDATEVENLKSENKILSEKVSNLEQTVDNVVTKLNEICL